jgi:Zn-dependent protease
MGTSLAATLQRGVTLRVAAVAVQQLAVEPGARLAASVGGFRIVLSLLGGAAIARRFGIR